RYNQHVRRHRSFYRGLVMWISAGEFSWRDFNNKDADSAVSPCMVKMVPASEINMLTLEQIRGCMARARSKRNIQIGYGGGHG
ncbi:MAG: hypothetical protein AABZ84_10625, partial [Pseudomonadota bacterium]